MKQERVFYYFEQISRIPRESGNEMAVSDWIYNWTKEIGLEAAQDAAFNLVIRKKASPGYENSAPVILQAHMDMVCEKTPESGHDFSKDPIELALEGDWLMSAGGTTLGADNGIGMACAMAILEDQSLAHPPLEVIFTVEEETTFKGANAVAPEWFQGRRMINLDHADDGELIAGSCGGTGVSFSMPLEWETVSLCGLGLAKEDGPLAGCGSMLGALTPYTLKVCGLEGGHSGEDIHRGRGNAIQLLMRLLQAVVDRGGRVVSISGGTNRLAICREAESVVLWDGEESLEALAASMEAAFRKELGKGAPNLAVKAEPCGTFENAMRTAQGDVENALCLTRRSFENTTAIVRLFPDGVIGMSGELPGLVSSSNNLGILRALPEDKELRITCEIRGQYQTMVEDTKKRIEMLGDIFGAQISYFDGYCSWEYAKESCLRETALEVYRDLFGQEMRVSTVHAGLEGGMFAEKAPDMDIISVGPTCRYFHSPMERVSVSSVKKFCGFLTALLVRLK